VAEFGGTLMLAFSQAEKDCSYQSAMKSKLLMLSQTQDLFSASRSVSSLSYFRIKSASGNIHTSPTKFNLVHMLSCSNTSID